MVLRVCLSKHPFHALCNNLCIFFAPCVSFHHLGTFALSRLCRHNHVCTAKASGAVFLRLVAGREQQILHHGQGHLPAWKVQTCVSCWYQSGLQFPQLPIK